MKIDAEIERSVAAFGAKLEREGIPVDSLLIFGSYAKNTQHADSDIDVCVVSSAFGKDEIEEMQMLFKKRRGIDTRIEPYPLSREEFSHGQSPIVTEIRAYGVPVALA